jgi:hypothetical protein
MSASRRAVARRPLTRTVGWATPGLALVATAIGLAVVAGPTLGQHVTIPRRLVVPVASPAPRSTAAPATARRATPKPSVSPTPTPASTFAPARVVAPLRPVVTESSGSGRRDDGHQTGSPDE